VDGIGGLVAGDDGGTGGNRPLDVINPGPNVEVSCTVEQRAIVMRLW
jgi:hypothetical protein